MKTVLVPVDFTSFSENAVKMAGHFAGVKSMDVKLLHIIEQPTKKNIFQNKKEKEEYMPEIVQTAEEQLEKMASCYIPVHIKTKIEVRKTSESITDEILKEDADVIIMGRRRPENRESFWAGSVAEKIVRLSATPVITVGELINDYKIKNIAFASDFQEDDIKPVLQRVLDLSLIFNADLHLVYVQLNREYLNNKQTESKVYDLLKKFDLENFDINIYVADTEEEGISRYIEENETDLLAMCTHGRTGLAHFFRQSIAENISTYGTVPVLTYNINKEKIDRSTQPIARKIIKERTKESKKL